MRRSVALIFVLGACARDDGRWPSLAPRPAELRGLDAMHDGEPVRTDPALPPISAAAGPLTSRLAAAEHDFAGARHGLSVEEAAMASALAAARGARKGSDAVAAAELQLTRLDAVAARFDDLAPAINSVARDAGAFDPATLGRARALAAGLAGDRADLSRLTQAARDALAR